jgi:hypothetical protein
MLILKFEIIFQYSTDDSPNILHLRKSKLFFKIPTNVFFYNLHCTAYVLTHTYAPSIVKKYTMSCMCVKMVIAVTTNYSYAYPY